MDSGKQISRMTRAVLACVFVLLGAYGGRSWGQCDNGMEGRDFWLMFLHNSEGVNGVDSLPELSVVAAASYTTEIQVSIPQAGWADTVVAQPGEVVRVTLPYELAHGLPYAEVLGTGVHVTSDEPIALYASNFRFRMFDMTSVLPTEMLDTTYIMQTFDGTNSADYDEVGFVAVEDSTELCIVFRAYTSILYQYGDDEYLMALSLGAHDTLRNVLMSGETYQLRTTDYPMTFSGVKVFSNGKPFGAFQGSGECNVVLGNAAVFSTLDHLYEQTIPTKYWGRKFLVIPTFDYGVGSDLIEVTSAADNCEVRFNGDSVRRLAEGETFLIELRQMAASHGGETEGYLIETSEQACVIQYMGVDTITDGNEFNQYHNIGDPSSVYIPPVEQGPPSMRFQTVNTAAIQQHYVNITARTEDTANVRFDGAHLNFTPLECGYSFAKVMAPEGVHNITSNHSRVLAIVYGRGNRESYAYIAGMSTSNLKYRLFANDVDITFRSDTIRLCEGDKINFLLRGEDEGTQITWLINGIDVNEHDSIYLFQADAENVSSIAAAVPDNCDTLRAYVVVTRDTTSIDTTICEGTTFEIENTSYTIAGNYAIRLGEWGDCSVMNLKLRVKQMPILELETAIDCENERQRLTVTVTSDTVEPLWWSAVPEDTLLYGHEQNDTIWVSPSGRQGWYEVTAGDLCKTSKSVTVNRVVAAKAELEVTPERLTPNDMSFTAYDLSIDIGREWYVDGVQMDENGRTLLYYTNEDEDSLRVTLMVRNGHCRDTAEVWVYIDRESLWIPNVFTPGKEPNDKFAVVGKAVELVSIDIYNRRGVLVYHSDNPTEGWDGTHGGKPCPHDAYVWQLKYVAKSTRNSYKTKTGTVMLMR